MIPLRRRKTTKALRVLGLGKNDFVLSWTSSDPSVVTVVGYADGTSAVTAGKNTGEAVITAVTASQKKVTFRVKVQKKKVSLKGVQVAEKKITLTVGQQYDLQAVPKPVTAGGKLKFASSKKSVAKVSGAGIVTARKPGSAVITVKCGKKKVKVKVTVRRP